jgi:RimK family alpha-L-glutamate ligase
MRIAVLGNTGSWYVDALTAAARARGHESERLDYGALTARVGVRRGDSALPTRAGEGAETDNDIASPLGSLSRWDAVIVRTMPPGSLEQVVFRMDALHRLEQAGVTILNPPRGIECAVDKYLTTARLAAEGLPVPETMVCEGFDSAMAAFTALGGDVVVKPLFGAEGRGILRVSDVDMAHRVFRTLERLQAVLYLQRFVRHPGYDIRVLVLDGRPIGAVRRINPDDFRTNVSRNARAETHDPTDREIEYSLRAARCTDARFAGIDLLYDERGALFVIEVNAVPGWRAFERTTGIPVAVRVIESLERTRGVQAR